MKKLFSLFAAVAVVFTLAACEPETIYEDRIVYQDKIVYEDKIVKEIEVVYETITEYVTETVTEYVSADVESERFYKPGVYFNNSAVDAEGVYTYAVVVVDAYGQIAGIMFDDTQTTSEFLTDGTNLYVFIDGDGKSVPDTFRLISQSTEPGDYPSAADAITADDLVVGIHNASIAELTAIDAYETSRILGKPWVAKTTPLVDKVIADQSTYGVTTYASADGVSATNVDTDLTNVDELMKLVQEILDGQAALTEEVELLETPVHGLYTKQAVFANTGRIVTEENVYYNTSFVVVDAYGRIAGVFNDATAADTTVAGAFATSAILNDAWFTEAQAFSNAVVKNQGTDFLVLDADNGTTTQIPGVTMDATKVVSATNAALGTVELDLNDGTYYVTGEVSHGGHATMAVTVIGGDVVSIFLDNTTGTDEATVLRDEEWVTVSVFERVWTDDANEEQKEKILVYMDGTDYRVVKAYTDIADKDYSADARIELTDDEIADLEAVAGNYTKQILNDRYGMNAENNWYKQANTLAAEFVSEGVYGINLTDGEHTDIAGVTFGSINEYQQMFVEALLLAQADDKAMVEVATPATADAKLPAGTYFSSLEVNEKGQQYIGYMVVNAAGSIESIVFDAVLAKDDYVTTKNSLGDAYGLAKEEDQLEWFEQAAAFAKSVVENQDDVIDGIEVDFNYELDADFGTADFTGTDSITGVSISTDGFKALTTDLVQQALVAKIEMEANDVFDMLADKDILLYSEMGKVYFDLDESDLTFGTAEVDFKLDWESTDNGVLDVDSDDQDADLVEEFYLDVEKVDANTEITITYILTVDEYEFTKAITYTVQTVASAELAALNADEVNFEAYTQIEGLPTPLLPRATVAGGTFLGWFASDDTEFASGLTDTSSLEKGTHTLVAVVEYDSSDELTVSRELEVTVMSVEDALEVVAADVKPANILHNGEVTEGEFELSTTTDILGMNIEWMVASDDEGVTGETLNTVIGNDLTIIRTTTTGKVILSATVSNDMNATEEVLNFEFRAVPADAELITERLNSVINELDNLGVKYVDSNTGFNAGAGLVLDTIVKSGDFDDDTVVISWEENSENATITSGLLEVTALDTAGTEELVTVTATFTVVIDADTKVEIKKEFEFTLFR